MCGLAGGVRAQASLRVRLAVAKAARYRPDKLRPSRSAKIIC